MRKYKLSGKIRYDNTGEPLFQIVATKNFNDIKIGDTGGWMSADSILSHRGECWVHKDAIILNNSRVYGDAIIYDNVLVDNSKISGKTVIKGGKDLYGRINITDSVIDGDITIEHGDGCILDCIICGSFHTNSRVSMTSYEFSPNATILQKIKMLFYKIQKWLALNVSL